MTMQMQMQMQIQMPKMSVSVPVSMSVSVSQRATMGFIWGVHQTPNLLIEPLVHPSSPKNLESQNKTDTIF